MHNGKPSEKMLAFAVASRYCEEWISWLGAGLDQFSPGDNRDRCLWFEEDFNAAAKCITEFNAAIAACDSQNGDVAELELTRSAEKVTVFGTTAHEIVVGQLCELYLAIFDLDSKSTCVLEIEESQNLRLLKRYQRERAAFEGRYGLQGSGLKLSRENLDSYRTSGFAVPAPQANPDAPLIWKKAEDTPPESYSHGPLTGQKRELAKWILGSCNCDPRTLDTKLKNGTIWGRIDFRRQRSVWFKTAKKYAECNARKRDQESENQDE